MSTAISSDDLPKQYDHQQAQQRWYQFWEEQGYFHAEPDPAREPFTIVIPPPNVTGALHLGHALNNTLQDILIRQKRMQGYNTLWMPGTDHAGIATQARVEKRLKEEENLTRHDLGREKLIERIWQWKDQYEQRILGQLRQMGFSCDWERTRFTLDPVCARAVREFFFSLFQQDFIYRGKRLVNWDTFLQTAVSDDEVFHETVQGHFWHFKYPVVDPQPGEPEFVHIATTRPETMLGDTAVAVHPDPRAALDKLQEELRDKLAAASAKDRPQLEQQLESIRTRYETHLPRLEQLRDMAGAGRRLMLPLQNREIPLVTDNWAKPELGSGCVKVTPAHDPNDYEVGLRCGLPMINLLNTDGTLNEQAGAYQGCDMRTARKRVVADLDEAGLLEEIEDREIDLAHSDRSKTEIQPYLADQWFVKMEHLAQTAMDAVTDGRVEIHPQRYAKGYLDWLSEKRDWPVGRQLWWGHRIPIWSKQLASQAELDALCKQLDDHPAIEKSRAAYHIEQTDAQGSPEQRGESAATQQNSDHPLATIHVCIRNEDSALEGELEQLGFDQEVEVLDTWFSSALWPQSTLGWPEKTAELDYFFPTNTLITSRDIITLWVARMVLASLHNLKEVPFKQVYIHPKILDGFGETMSKTKGNGVDPLDVIDKFGADSLRFGLAYLTTETQDVRMPVEFECPHCHEVNEQTKKNRILPRVTCKKCGADFSTQWAEQEADLALPRAAVISERFEVARNFCNKLWNASRFAMLNLENYQSGPVEETDLAVEDRWVLSRLNTVTAEVTEQLAQFKYADAARVLYNFAWDEFCSFYVEIVKTRLQDDTQRQTAQRVLAYTLDTLLRLLHPMIPFLTEEVWQRLAQFAPQRGLAEVETPAASVMIARWPVADPSRQNSAIEQQFARFQDVLAAVREIRSAQNIPPKQKMEFVVRCDAKIADLLAPMRTYFETMAGARLLELGSEVNVPETSANRSISEIDVYVDMKDFIDVEAEIARNEKEADKLAGLITAKEKKLENKNFVRRAPEEVVQKERDSLAQLKSDLENVQVALEKLRRQS